MECKKSDYVIIIFGLPDSNQTCFIIRFLLARLQLDSLISKPTLRKMKAALNCLPEELDSMYDQAIERVQNQDPEFAALALRLLYWVHHAVRPLGVHELRHALAVEPGDSSFDQEGLPDEDILEAICAGMIVIQENNTVSLVHYTAQEYLKRKSSDLFPNANMSIAQTCLIYLSFDEFQDGPCPNDKSFVARCTDYPLIRYASRHWFDHLHIAGEAKLVDMVLSFVTRKGQLSSSVQAMQALESRCPKWSQVFARDVDELWISSTCGLRLTCERLLGQGHDVNSRDSLGHTPLHRAAIYGFVDIVRLLLDSMANIEAQSQDFGRNALQWAAWHGHEAIVKLLLERGAQIEAQDERKWTPLHLAASEGHEGVLNSLVGENLNMNGTDAYGATALYRAAEGGHEGSARLLLENGAQTDIKNDYAQTALHRAADLGHLAVCRLLLQRGAAYNIKDYYGWTPLYRAADHGHGEVATLLANFAEAAREASRVENCKAYLTQQTQTPRDNSVADPVQQTEIHRDNSIAGKDSPARTKTALPC